MERVAGNIGVYFLHIFLFSTHSHTHTHKHAHTHSHPPTPPLFITFLPYILVAHVHLTPLSAELSGNPDAVSLMCYLCSLTHHLALLCVLSRFSCVRLFVTPWTVAHQAPLSMAFPKQEYRNGLPFPPSGDIPDPGIQPSSLTSPALAGGFFSHLGLCQCEPRRTAG